MKRNEYYLRWIIFSILALSIIGIVSLKLPERGDEKHITETVRLFTNNFDFQVIKNYPEVTPPFFFYFYALWSKIFGSSIESLRILTLLISLIVWQLVFLINSYFVKKSIHAAYLSLLIIINPYFFGTSVFVFTDMLTLMLCLFALLSFFNNKVILFGIFSALAILCRQYAIIFPTTIIFYWGLIYFLKKENHKTYLVVSFLSFIPLVILFFVWGGISPESGSAKWVITNSAFYNVDYINTYITFSAIYSFPLVIYFVIKNKLRLSNLMLALLISSVLYFFPIKPSLAALQQTDLITVGIAHKEIIKIFANNKMIIKLFLLIFLIIGCYTNVFIVKNLIKKIKTKALNKKIIPTLVWIIFIFIMPLSYQVWEKYLTLILPFFIISIYLIIPTNKVELENQL